MKNVFLKTTAFTLLSSTVLFASGYKIPEASLNSVALGAAYIAHTTAADAAYYNPANMVFMDDENSMDMDLKYISLDAPNFKGTVSGTSYDINAESETFLVPSIHYVSEKAGDVRVGLSIVSPGGLSKRWTVSPAKDKAEEFTLQIIEVNPSIAIAINEEVAIALGLRVLHTSGVVKSTSTASRDMKGESFDFGYNLALSYKPTSDIDVALTYRSNVDLSVEGNAKLYLSGSKVYDGGASVSVPLPAMLSLAFAYTLQSKTTFEFVYERNMWSEYKELDFNYVSSIPLAIQPYFDDSIAKDWKDTNDFRLGITQELEKLTLMAGIVYSENPVPDETLSFELPDSDSLSVSFGGRYQINKKLDLGLAALYSMRESRSVTNADLSGEFTNSNVLMISAGVGYKF
ncbi:porin [bacterium]|nr:porin [bacterium]